MVVVGGADVDDAPELFEFCWLRLRWVSTTKLSKVGLSGMLSNTP